LAKHNDGEFRLLEDGFIRSIGLGVDNAPTFSIVVDDRGMYYDARTESRMEYLIKTIDINEEGLKEKAQKAIDLILKYEINKYNNSVPVPKGTFQKKESNVLILSQIKGDVSLELGLANDITTLEMIEIAKKENPTKNIYVKLHPDILSGKKKSDISLEDIPEDVKVVEGEYNSVSTLKNFSKVYVKTSGMGFEALLTGCEVVCFGVPFYSGWGLTDDRQKCDRRGQNKTLLELFAAAYIKYPLYYNHITKKQSDIIDIIETINIYKEQLKPKRNKIFLFGFTLWKHSYMKPFLKEYKKENIYFLNPEFKKNKLVSKLNKKTIIEQLKQKGISTDDEIFIWGKKEFKEVEEYANNNNIKITRVEDGFIRSLGLGSDLTRPYSQVFDKRGIYFDSTCESDLEYILKNNDFNDYQRQKGREIIDTLLESKLSKYNLDNEKKLNLPKNKNIILIPGQVEDDASIRFGGNGMTNLELIKKVRETKKDSYLIYKPHPDVLSGTRVGNIEKEEVLKYCDEIQTNISINSILNQVNEVHTITSLTGLEGLLNGKNVVCYGTPFYSGWGLTVDINKCERRGRKLTLEELVVGTYLLYPKYIHPQTLEYCEPITLIKELSKQKELYENNKSYKTMVDFKAKRSRIGHKILKMIKRFV